MIIVLISKHKVYPFRNVSDNEGCAGMAAIVDPDCDLDLSELYKDLQKALPSFAIPVFLRLLAEVEMTGERVVIQTIHVPLMAIPDRR